MRPRAGRVYPQAGGAERHPVPSCRRRRHRPRQGADARRPDARGAHHLRPAGSLRLRQEEPAARACVGQRRLHQVPVGAFQIPKRNRFPGLPGDCHGLHPDGGEAVPRSAVHMQGHKFYHFPLAQLVLQVI